MWDAVNGLHVKIISYAFQAAREMNWLYLDKCVARICYGTRATTFSAEDLNAIARAYGRMRPVQFCLLFNGKEFVIRAFCTQNAVNIADPRFKKMVGPWSHRPYRFLRLWIRRSVREVQQKWERGQEEADGMMIMISVWVAELSKTKFKVGGMSLEEHQVTGAR